MGAAPGGDRPSSSRTGLVAAPAGTRVQKLALVPPARAHLRSNLHIYN